MFLKNLKIIVGLGLFAASSIAYSEVIDGVEAESRAEVTTDALPVQETPQQLLSALINNYQKICNAENCHKQLKQLKKYGRWGDAKSQLMLGSAYLYGDGVEQDTDKAISWLKRAAYNTSSNAGKYSLYAFHLMAKLYQNGIGVKQDQQLATKYLDKLAEKQYGPVLFDRAFIAFEQGNLKQGINLLDQASESRFVEASYYLARMYQQGNFIEKDINKAALYYEKVVKRDYKDSRHRLALIIEEMEENSTSLAANELSEEQRLINKLNATLNIEVITVNSYGMKKQDAMTNLLVGLSKNKARFAASTGSRIKGRTCGQTSYPCKGMTSEDIEDAINEGGGSAF